MPYRSRPDVRAIDQEDTSKRGALTSEDVAVTGVILVLGIILAVTGILAGPAGVTTAAIGMIMTAFALWSFLRGAFAA